MESRQKGLSRKNNAPERRIDRKRENFSRFWLGATSSATHTLSFRRLIKKEHNSWVQLSTAAVPRHLSRCNFWPHFLPPAFLFRRICVFHFPVVLLVSSPVTSVTRLSRSPLLATKVQGVRRQTQLCNRPWLLWNLPLRAHEKENDNLQQYRQQKATQTLVVQNMDSAIHSGLNHYREDKYYGNQLHYPVNRDLSGGLSAIHLELENLFPR